MKFDKETFLSTHIEAPMETKFTPLPEDDYRAVIDDIDFVEMGQGENKSNVLVVVFAVLDAKAREFMKMDKPTVKHNIFLDFESDGRLSFGTNKNIGLGMLRDALGQNTGAPWNFNMLRGAGPVLLKINHRWNKQTGEGPFSNVKLIAKAS